MSGFNLARHRISQQVSAVLRLRVARGEVEARTWLSIERAREHTVESRIRGAHGRRGRVLDWSTGPEMSVTSVARRRKHGQEPATMEAAARLSLRSGTHLGRLGLVDGSPLSRARWTEIESEIMAGRYAIACRNLDKLLSWKADPDGGIVYLLGSCELARGRNQAAGEAWARVVPGSAFSERAIRGRMRLFQESGQLAAAERLINDAAEDPRNDRTALLVLLVPMLQPAGPHR